MKIGITRPSDQLAEITEKATQRGVDIVALPLTTITAIPFEWPLENFPDAVDWLIFTSGNAVNIFFEQLNQNDKNLDQNIKIASIGEKTSRVLKKYNQTPEMTSSNSYGKILFAEFVNKFKAQNLSVVYARAKEVVNDPSELFSQNKINLYSLICYETLENKIEKSLVEEFAKDDLMLFTSPSNVKSYANQIGKPHSSVLAIGDTTAGEMRKQAWDKFEIMNNHDINNVLEYI